MDHGQTTAPVNVRMRYPDLDLDLLRCFATVAERGGFTAAGVALGLTQSAISLKVKRLEDLLGRRVFDRTSRSLALTPQGETLLAYARRMLALNDEAVRRMIAPPRCRQAAPGRGRPFRAPARPRHPGALLPHLPGGGAGVRGRPQP
jgi:DNA-binding transcriptional LysR family regulator